MLESYREAYGARTLDELNEQLDHEGNPITESVRLADIFGIELIDEVRKQRPAWFGGGVPIRGFEVDCVYRSKRKQWDF